MRALLALAALAPASAAQANVWVVDDTPGPGVDFADVAPAVAAASPGDLVLVKAGTYGAVTIVGGLALIAENGASVLVASLTVENVPAGEQVLVRGIDVDGCLTRVRSCAGHVRFEDCTLGTVNPLFPMFSDGQTRVEDSARVSFLRCTILGACAISAPTILETGAALVVRSSQVHLFDCAIESGDFFGAGAFVDRSFAFFSGCSIEGGFGWDGDCFSPPADGAAGLWIDPGADPEAVYLLDTTLVGGAGGADPCSFGSGPGAPGPPAGGDLTALATIAGAARHFEATAVVRGAQSAAFAFEGELGDFALLAVSATLDALFDAAFLHGTQLVGAPLLVPMGAMDALGELTVSVPMPPLPPGVDAFLFHGQGVFLTATRVRVGPSSAMALVDSAF